MKIKISSDIINGIIIGSFTNLDTFPIVKALTEQYPLKDDAQWGLYHRTYKRGPTVNIYRYHELVPAHSFEITGEAEKMHDGVIAEIRSGADRRDVADKYAGDYVLAVPEWQFLNLYLINPIQS